MGEGARGTRGEREINLRREIRKSGGVGPPLLVRQDSIVSRATAINVFQTRPPVPRAAV